VPSADPTARKPRILSAVPAQPIHVEATKPVAPAKPHQKIPASQFGRIRTWLKYGMTIAQVAELYGATVGDVESILKGSLTVTG
jgi:hypothetical protein